MHRTGNLPYLVANTHDLKLEVLEFSRGQKPPIRGAYSNQEKLKFWESALFSD